MAGGFRYSENAMHALEHCLRSGFYGYMSERWDEGRLLTPPISVRMERDDYRMRHIVRFLMDGREELSLVMADDCSVVRNLGDVLNMRAALQLWEGEYYAIVRERTDRFFAEARMAARMTATLHESLDQEEFHRRLREAIDAYYERRHRGCLWSWAPHLDSFHLVYRTNIDLWNAIHDHEESRGRSTVNGRMANLADTIRRAAQLVPDPARFINAVFGRTPAPGRVAPRQDPIYLLTRSTTEESMTNELAQTVASLTEGERAALTWMQANMQDAMQRNTLQSLMGSPSGLGPAMASAGGGGAYQAGLMQTVSAAQLAQQQAMSLAQARNNYDYARRQQADPQMARAYAMQLQAAMFDQQTQEIQNRVNPYLNSVMGMMGVDFAQGVDETAWAYRYTAARRNDFAGLYLGQWDRHTEAAERKGMRVLRESLNAEQLESLDQRGFFDVRGGRSGKTYRIKHGKQMNIEEIDGRGRKVCGWCFVPKGNLVAGDVMLTQKLALELQEVEALRVANRF